MIRYARYARPVRRFIVVSGGIRREWFAERDYLFSRHSCDPSYTSPPSGAGWVAWSRHTARVHGKAGSLTRVLRSVAAYERRAGHRDVRVYDSRGALVIR
jgi:hypothetical protein